MSGDYPDPAERAELRDEETVLVDLMDEYMNRRGAGALAVYPDLRARAAEFGDRCARNFETLVVCWETARLRGDA